jgi:hypothetical protein
MGLECTYAQPDQNCSETKKLVQVPQLNEFKLFHFFLNCIVFSSVGSSFRASEFPGFELLLVGLMTALHEKVGEEAVSRCKNSVSASRRREN